MYYVHNEEILKNCIQAIKEDMPVSVSISKKKRSLNQNAMYWKWLEIISDYTGYTKDDLHDKFRLKFLPKKTLEVDGRLYRLPTSTTDLNTKDFTEYLNKIELVACGMELNLPSKRDYGY